MSDLFIRIDLDAGHLFGPGKAALLERIDRTHSIRGAAAAMDMSYRRAWLLLKEMEDMFGAPVIARATGGAKGGGADLTDLGRSLLARYRAIEKKAAKAAASDISALRALTAKPSKRKSRAR